MINLLRLGKQTKNIYYGIQCIAATISVIGASIELKNKIKRDKEEKKDKQVGFIG